MAKRRKAMELDIMTHWDFAHDDGENPAVLDMAKKMVEGFPTLRKNGTGLFIYGGPRAGKSYLAAEIVNELTDRGYKCYMISLLGLFNLRDRLLLFFSRQVVSDSVTPWTAAKLPCPSPSPGVCPSSRPLNR